jgi:xanthine dehydrogenase small subunit
VRDRVRFLLGGERRELAGIDPTMTVLDYLRLAERRTGTKEGCNEGDCGACTVVVGRLEEGALRYHTINACIAFVGMLDGAQLLTVEDLRSPDGGFHPAQAAMVDCHGSQCGFCTPGFVMSLFALGQEGGALDPGRIDDALAGNLCRCTGYAPIVAAAERMREIGGGDLDHLGTKAEIAQRLGSLQDEETLVLEGDDRRFFAPATVSALADLLEQHPEAVILAGGTDVGLWVTKQLKKLDPVIWIGRIAELKGIEETGDRLRIGAGVTYSEALDRLAGLYPDLGELFRRLGGLQVRNAGTIGGNIANGSRRSSPSSWGSCTRASRETCARRSGCPGTPSLP